MTGFIEVLANDQDEQKLIMGHNKMKIIVTFITFKNIANFSSFFFRLKKIFCFFDLVDKVFFHK